MTTEEQIKEMETVIRDILNPYNDKDPEVEAWLLVDRDGWRKQVKGEWVDLSDSGNGWFQNGQRVFPKHCSICGEVYSYALKYKFCPNCGAYMKKE